MRYSKILLAIVLISMLVFGSTLSAYAATTYTATVTVDESSVGMGTVTGGGDFEPNAEVPITATPIAGYQFVKWVLTCVGGTDESINPSDTFNMHEHNVAVEAYFEDMTYIITTEVNDPLGGSVTGGGEFEYSQNVNIVATANPGYHFVKWLADFGDGIYGPTPFSTSSFTCNLEHCGNGYFPVVKLRAYFAADETPVPEFDVTVIVNGDVGSGTVTGAGGYDEGDPVTITAIPSLHYYLDDMESLDLDNVDEIIINADGITFDMPDQDVEITVFFKENFQVMATIQYVNASDVAIQAATQTKVYVGAYTLTPPAISGYTFTSSTANASGTVTEQSVGFTVVHKYAALPPATEPTTQPTTEAAVVIIPTTTEVITTEPVALAPPVIVNFDEIVEDMPINFDEIVEDTPSEEVVEEDVPLADALPATGQLSVDYFYGIGGLISGLGLWLKRRK